MTKASKKDLKSSFMTIRLPQDIAIDLRLHAQKETRTLAAQVLHYIKRGLENDRATIILGE